MIRLAAGSLGGIFKTCFLLLFFFFPFYFYFFKLKKKTSGNYKTIVSPFKLSLE